MSLRIIIEEKYKSAIKTRKSEEVNTLRLIKSAIKDKDIASRSGDNKEGIGESEILLLLQSLIKQRNDSIDSFKLASRKDLIAIEQTEINIISQFLPKQMNEIEIEKLILNIINNFGLISIKDMGKLMNELKINHSGNLDMALAGKIAKSKLSN